MEFSFEKILTDAENSELEAKKEDIRKNIKSINTKASNLYSSIRLCETRQQVLEILKRIGLVDTYGVALEHDDIKTKHFD